MAQHKGLLTKGAKFSYCTLSADPVTGEPVIPDTPTWIEIANVTRMPALGGDVEKVEVTTLADSAHQYIPGLIEYGDLDFTLLFDNEESTSNYRTIKSLENIAVGVQVELGDKPATGTHGTQFQFIAILSAS